LKLLAPILSHMQLFEAPRTYFEPILSSCNYLKLPAPFSSHLQLFEASRTIFEPLEII